VLLVGFVPEREAGQLYGFNVEATVPCERWLRAWQQHLDNAWLQGLLTGTVHSLQAEIPGLGVTVATDVKHIYAWVQQNNPKAYVSQRYDPKRQPPGDPDCRLGVKRQHNQVEPDGSSHAHTEYVWGYGTGVASATHPLYGDVVLAEYTQTFNESDVTYFRPIQQRTQAALGLAPTNWAADAAYDAWYVYQAAAEQGGLAAVPFNRRGQPAPQLDERGFPICPRGLSMHAGAISLEAGGFHTLRLQCPLLFPRPTGQTCDHEQFAKGPGCIKQLNIELGGLLRLRLDRHSDAYRAIYKQRTSTERINSQATALGVERPRVRNIHSVRNLNTLTYILINVRALKRVRAINARARPPDP
jgi:Transposase DDE domain